MGVPEEEARYYDSEFQAGRTIVTVQAGGRYQEALDILRRQGAYVASTRGSTATGTMSGATAYTSSGASSGTPTATSYTSSRWENVAPGYRNSWQQRYGSSGERWEDYEPAYRYGWERYNEPQYRSRSWTELEPDFQRDWESRYPNRPWNRFGNAVREAWDNLTGGSDTRYDPNYRGPTP
jgi:FAD/FMN-containing dehydrogenase